MQYCGSHRSSHDDGDDENAVEILELQDSYNMISVDEGDIDEQLRRGRNQKHQIRRGARDARC